jgi:putative transposase
VLSRVLYATQFTRHLDRHGYIRFQDWRLYGERGLAKAPVSVWVYEDTLKVEYQAVTLSTYRVERSDDHRRVTQIESPRVMETIFRSPQLTLFDLGPDEWLLYWKAPAYAPRKPHRSGAKVTQLVLFEVPGEAKAAGAETAPPLFRLVRAPQERERE